MYRENSDTINKFVIKHELLDAPFVAHGGGKERDNMYDFSVCLNPYPIPGEVTSAMEQAEPRRYPDPDAGSLVEHIAAFHGCDRDKVVVFNGISQAIFLTAFALLERGSRTLIIGPTYGEYEKNSRLMGAEVYRLDSSEEDRFMPDVHKIEKEIIRIGPSVVWLCNPNNPSGVLLKPEQLAAINKACLAAGSFLVVDEAYMNFVPKEEQYTAQTENLITPASVEVKTAAGTETAAETKQKAEGENSIVLRSMTKDFSIPGLRLGYTVSNSRLAMALRRARPEWSINAAALGAGETSLQVVDKFKAQWETLHRETCCLAEQISEVGYTVYPPKANFILIKDDFRGGINPARFAAVLKENNIAVRDCTSLGLPGFLRIGTSLPQYNKLLVEALQRSDLWEK